MNNEIKEILEQMSIVINKPLPMLILAPEYTKTLLDYITNLQQINDNLTTSLNKKIEEGINLQQENHELKSKLECYENGVYYSSKVDELEQENEILNSMLNNADNKNLSLIEEINEKYDIIEKAIKYNKEIIDNYLEEDDCEYCDGRYATAKHNLNILQNGVDSQ